MMIATRKVTEAFDLHGVSFGGGDDEASIIFIQNGDWRTANLLSNGGQNGLNGSQTVTIPISSFHKVGDGNVILDPNQAVSNLHARFWNSNTFTVDVTSIMVLGTGGNTPTPTLTPTGAPTATPTATPTGTPGAVSYTYDANGNMTSDGGKCYEYNEANQLVKVKQCNDNQTIAEYVYDYTGLRMIKKNYTGGTLANTVISWSDSFETRAIGGTTESTTYYFANKELIAKKNPDGSTYFINTDHLGSTSVITNATGGVVEETQYDPWGEVLSGGTKSKFLYTGQEKDSETGLNYYNARYYSSDIKRFTQPDDFIENVYDPQTLNRYSYVRNNPLKYTDPTGHINEILAYNNALNQYYKNPNAKTYNNVLNTADKIQKQTNTSTSSSSSSNNNKSNSGSNNAGSTASGGVIAAVSTQAKNVATKITRANATVGTIYRAFNEFGRVDYVGKTIDFARRQKEWARLGREIVPYIEEVPIKDLSAVEQATIEKYGLENLKNIRNAISQNSSTYINAAKIGALYLMYASL